MRSVGRGGAAVILALVLLLGGCSSGSNKPNNSKFGVAAKQAVDDIATGDFSKVAVHFDPDVASHYPAVQLASDWQTFQDKAGSYVSRGEPKEVVEGQITTELVPVKLSKHKGQVQVSYHPDGTIAGIHFAQK